MSLMRRKIKRIAITCLSLTMCATFAASCATVNLDLSGKGSGSYSESLKFTDVTKDYDTTGLSISNFNSSVLENTVPVYETRTVIVSLSGDSLLDLTPNGVEVSDYVNSTAGQSAKRAIDREQKTFLSKLSSRHIGYKLKASYSTIINAVAIEVDTSYVKQIKSTGGVTAAAIAQTYLAPQVEETSGGSAVSNDANVYATGIYDTSAYADESWGTGNGMVVAVLDTGLDYSHEAFRAFTEEDNVDPKYDAAEVAERLVGTSAYERIANLGSTLTIDDVYVSNKVPFAFDYADNDADVYPSYSNHGTHVAGIVAGRADSYVDKEGNVPVYVDPVDNKEKPVPFRGVAPDAQLMIFKTFTDNLDDPALGGAESENIMSALEDCVTMGVDVINMSLGTTAGFTTTNDGDDEGEIYNKIFNDIQDAGISLICAASNDYSAGTGSVYGTNLASNPDSGTVGSPSTYFAAISVASISGQKSQYLTASDGSAIFFDNSSNGSGTDYDFVGSVLPEGVDEFTFRYYDAGSGTNPDYRLISRYLSANKADGIPTFVLVKRGGNTFQQKVEIAKDNDATGIIIWNNVSGTIKMSLGDLDADSRIPAISIDNDAGNLLLNLIDQTAREPYGEVTVKRSNEAGPFMSSFSSWGTTSDLKIKPEITAHGGEITSTVPGGYAEQSGTSMASPNMAGLMAIVRNYINNNNALTSLISAKESNLVQIANQLLMSTASIARDTANLPYSPRKQGAGLANIEHIVSSQAYLYTDNTTSNYYEGRDGRPKIEFGDDAAKKGVYTFDFKVRNFSATDDLQFTLSSQFMTETLSTIAAKSVKEQAYMLDDINPVFMFNGSAVSAGNKITVGKNSTATIGVTLELSAAEKKYIDESFINGMFVEGFITLEGTGKQCDLNIPFLGFYGDWKSAPMLDYTAYEIAAINQDTSYIDDRPSETVWATQPYASYNGENYVIPMGSYVYTLADSDIPMYANMEYNAVSCYNEIVSEDGIGNYTSSYNIRCVYAGLLRNAQKVNYKLSDAYTGEVITTGEKFRISKAYANGGTARPAYVEIMLTPQELGLVSNGKYTFEFEFLFDKKDEGKLTDEQKANSTFTFDFYVDYDAPTLQDARIRYQDYKESNKDKQRIYLDLDVYDNHYAQSVMLLYIDENGGQQELKLATDYATPVRNPNRNGVTTVSIEVTDIWDKYKDVLAVQIDDYALNHTNYIFGNLNPSTSIDETLNKSSLPDTFELAEGEENITLDINEMHKVSLVYDGDANLSNFGWSTVSSGFVAVKNGEIVGLASTDGESYPVFVTNYKGVTKKINVTVTNTVASIRGVKFGFAELKNYNEAIVAGSDIVSVYAGEEFTLELQPDTWYYPMSNITSVEWSSTNPSVASVDENGTVHTHKRGSATISATVRAGNTEFPNVNLMLSVLNEFTVNGVTLTRYRGEGEDHINPVTKEVEHNVVIVPPEITITEIGEEAFKDNDKIKKIIIPKTVTQIGKRAFQNCTALEVVCFQTDEEFIDGVTVSDADLTIIDRNAFEGCSALTTIDNKYTKVFTVAREAFKDCVNLSTITKTTAIGTAGDRAFMGCKSLTEFDASALHVAGANIFSGCVNLENVTFGEFSAIGENMFAYLDYQYTTFDYSVGDWNYDNHTEYLACDKISEVTIKSSLVGAGAFEGLKGLKKVTFTGTDVRIRETAFMGCENLSTVDYSNATIKSIGENAFAGTAWQSARVSSSGDVLLSDDGTTILLYTGNASTYIVGSGITKIAPYAFANSSVKKINNLGQITEIGEGAFKGSLLEEADLSGLTSEVSAYAFCGTLLKSVTLPNSLTNIGDYAFADCKLLTGFVFAPVSAAKFGNGVFSGCTGLTTISLGKNITEIGDLTFFGCIKLESATLSAVEKLGNRTFFNTPALKEVTFDADATSTGTNTFAAYRVFDYETQSYLYPATRSALTKVIFGTATKQLGEGVFLNCTGITSFDLKGITIIGANAFYGATALTEVTGLDNVTEIGEYAFYNARLTALNLSSVKTIGDGAFMVERGLAYTTVSFPVAETIGARAFYGNNAKEINIPATLTKIGGGAFANSPSLRSFTVTDNDIFFVQDGVLYRYLTSSAYGLVAFPSAKSVSEYTVPDGTARIDAGAFLGHKGTINKITMPYSLKSVGDMAFYNSGITVYAFQSVTAPALEAEYSEYIHQLAEAIEVTYRGGYNANFENYYFFYAYPEAGVTPAQLTIYYPSNGTGYNTPVYTAYFSEKNLTEITMTEEVYQFVTNVSSFPAASDILGWTTDNKSTKEVQDFSDTVKHLHEYYDTFKNDEVQLGFVDGSLITKFNEVENALRVIKPVFGIKVSVLRLEAAGNFRTEYRIGERFDMTGLQVVIVYDDYSTENADMSKVTIVSPTGALNELDTTVTLALEGYTQQLRIRIYVTENGPTDGGCAASGCGSITSTGGPTFLTLTAAGALILISAFARKKYRGRK